MRRPRLLLAIAMIATAASAAPAAPAEATTHLQPSGRTAASDGVRAASGDGPVLVWAVGNRVRAMTLAAGEPWTVTRQKAVREADLSPDRRRVVTTSFANGPDGLFVTGLHGGHRHNILGARAHRFIIYTAAWSPDGKRIAFGGWHKTKGESLWVVRRDGSRLRFLTGDFSVEPDGAEESLQYSPDGTELTWAPEWSDPDYVPGMPVYSFTTGKTRHVGDRHGYWYDWSPDGSWVIFTEDDQVKRMRPSGADVQTVVDVGDPEQLDLSFSSPDWVTDDLAILDEGDSLYGVDPMGLTTDLGSPIPGSPRQHVTSFMAR
jgi:WD40 repeat protein